MFVFFTGFSPCVLMVDARRAMIQEAQRNSFYLNHRTSVLFSLQPISTPPLVDNCILGIYVSNLLSIQKHQINNYLPQGPTALGQLSITYIHTHIQRDKPLDSYLLHTFIHIYTHTARQTFDCDIFLRTIKKYFHIFILFFIFIFNIIIVYHCNAHLKIFTIDICTI